MPARRRARRFAISGPGVVCTKFCALRARRHRRASLHRHGCCSRGVSGFLEGSTVALKSVEQRRPEDLDREERELAARAVRGDRAAFDQLYDRYFDRVAWQFRDLPEPEARAAIWETLEQVFAGLQGSDLPLAARAYRIALASQATARARLATAKRR